MEFIVLPIIFMTILCSKYIHKNWINPHNALALPYFVIILIHKLYGESLGFYPISNKTMIIVTIGIVLFFLGTSLTMLFKRNEYQSSSLSFLEYEDVFKFYRIKGMLNYALIVVAISGIRTIYQIYRLGIRGLSDNEGLVISGIIGHLMLTIYPIVPVLFFYWLKHRKTKYKWRILAITICYIGMLFLTFVKYHVAGIIIIIFLLSVNHEPKYFKKGVVILSTLVIGLFVLNYVAGFISANIIKQVNRSFYTTHLWGYISGSLINSGKWISGFPAATSSVPYKLLSYIFVLPNMFISTIFKENLFPVASGVPMSIIGNNMETSNVVDAISTLYPSNGDALEVIFFSIAMIALGGIFEYIFIKQKGRNSRLQISTAVIMTFMLFFSFFGTFYMNPMPWEIIVYSYIIIGLFDKRIRLKL